MRNSKLIVALCAFLFTVSVKSQSCSPNISVVTANCPIGTGCPWTDPTIWACGGVPNGALVTVNMNTVGSYQINTNAADSLSQILLQSLNLGTAASDDKNLTSQVLSTTGVGFQFSSTATVNGRGIWNADFQSALFNGQLTLTNGGQFNYISGSFVSQAQIIVNAGCQFNITSSAAHSLGQPLQNSGTVRLSGAPVTLSRAVQLNNDGVLELSDGSSIAFTTFGAEKITSAGVIRFRTYQPILTPSSINVLLESPGMVDVSQLGVGKITSDGSTIDNLVIAPGSSFTLDAPNLSLKNVTNNGTLAWTSGTIAIKTSGTFLNDVNGLWTITTPGSINSGDNTGVIRNRGTLTTNADAVITFGAPVYLLGGNLNQGGSGGLSFQNLNVVGGRLSGTGSISTNAFNWDSGDISGVGIIEIKGTAAITGSTPKILGGSREFLFNGQTPAQISSTITASSSGTKITVGDTGTVNFFSAVLTLTNPLINKGQITGVATINGGLSNFGTLGAVGFSATSNAVKLQVQGILTLNPTSTVNIDLFSDQNDYGYLRCNQVANLAGVLNIRAREGLFGTEGLKLKLVSATTIIGQFAAINTDWTMWSNPNGCTITADFNQVDGVSVLFSGCAGSAPGPTPKPASTRLRTFAIVFVVIVLIIIGVGLVAKCQKKCRKRPWDRLRDDRY